LGTYFLLFDIDGVLINPSGYRKAVYDTTNYFLHKLGFSKISINEEIITSFESIGITSEWDIVPLYLLIVTELSLIQNPAEISLENIQDCYNFFRKFEFQPDQKKIISSVLFLKEFIQDGYSACDSLLIQNFGKDTIQVFNHVRSKISWIINAWIKESRNIWKSEILQYFQNLTLGSELFQEITGLDSIQESEPYLVKHDNSMVLDETRHKILRISSKNNVFPSVITARPSSFPNGFKTEESQLDFPEAELALKCLKLEQIPCVGFGAMEYLGKEKVGTGDQFVKPSPIHAMTAILLSSGMEIIDALRLSYDYFFNDYHTEMVEYLSRFAQPFYVCIFEDSIIGIQSLEIACESLKNENFEIDMIAYGISTERNKIEALLNENAIIFPTINEAFSACVDDMKI
jgi:hypothetical protein